MWNDCLKSYLVLCYFMQKGGCQSSNIGLPFRALFLAHNGRARILPFWEWGVDEQPASAASGWKEEFGVFLILCLDCPASGFPSTPASLSSTGLITFTCIIAYTYPYKYPWFYGDAIPICYIQARLWAPYVEHERVCCWWLNTEAPCIGCCRFPVAVDPGCMRGRFNDS